VNTLAATGTDHSSLLAAMTMPVTGANTTPAPHVFVNMISLFLSSPHQGTPRTASDTARTASPAQIADAMIRSMLGSTTPAQAQSKTAAPATTVMTDVADDVLSTAGSDADLDDSTKSADSILRSVLANPTSGNVVAAADLAVDDLAAPVAVDAASGNKAKPGAAHPSQTQAPEQQLLSATDVPITANAITASVTAPAPDISRSNAVQENPVASPAPAAGLVAPLAKGSIEAKVAFSAILTPNQTTGPSAALDASKQGSPSPEPEINATFSIPVASTTPQNASQQRDDSQESPASAPVLPADAKNKATVAEDNNEPQAIVTSAAGTVPDHAEAFSSLTEQGRATEATASAASTSIATSPQATSSRATAEALRTSESDLAAAPQTRTGAVQEITIRIEQPDALPVDLRVVERSGQLHVDVRTPDAAIETSLREDLGTLTNSLERAGYHAETFTPSSGLGRTALSAQTSNQNDHQDSPQNRGGSGGSSEGRRQQQPQKRPSTWLEEMEDQ